MKKTVFLMTFVVLAALSFGQSGRESFQKDQPDKQPSVERVKECPRNHDFILVQIGALKAERDRLEAELHRIENDDPLPYPRHISPLKTYDKCTMFDDRAKGDFDLMHPGNARRIREIQHRLAEIDKEIARLEWQLYENEPVDFPRRKIIDPTGKESSKSAKLLPDRNRAFGGEMAVIVKRDSDSLGVLHANG